MKRRFTDDRGRPVARGDGHKRHAPALRRGELVEKTPAGEAPFNPFGGEAPFNPFGGGAAAGSWKQPGRRFGPPPMGTNPPKHNKLTDRDGNGRTAPLGYDVRMARYLRDSGRLTTLDALHMLDDNPIYFRSLPATARAAMLGLTPRQRRRLEHKRNHAAAPFGTGEVRS